jgi:hypothetical protein
MNQRVINGIGGLGSAIERIKVLEGIVGLCNGSDKDGKLVALERPTGQRDTRGALGEKGSLSASSMTSNVYSASDILCSPARRLWCES